MKYLNFRDECSQQVHKFPGARFKKFQSEDEAREFIRINSNKPGM